MRDTVRPAVLFLGMSITGCLTACDEARPPLAQYDVVSTSARQAAPDRGRQLITEKGCIACHVVPQVHAPSSHVGPALGHIARQGYLGGVLPNTPPNLVRWLMNPPAISPRTAMPNVGLRQAEAEDIAAFLITLP